MVRERQGYRVHRAGSGRRGRRGGGGRPAGRGWSEGAVLRGRGRPGGGTREIARGVKNKKRDPREELHAVVRNNDVMMCKYVTLPTITLLSVTSNLAQKLCSIFSHEDVAADNTKSKLGHYNTTIDRAIRDTSRQISFEFLFLKTRPPDKLQLHHSRGAHQGLEDTVPVRP